MTYDAGEIFWKMEVRISSVAIVLCLSEIVGNSCRNKSIKDTDPTYMIVDTALLLIEPVTLIFNY